MARPTLFSHPKYRRLVHILREPEPHVVGYLIYLWQVAYESGDDRIGDVLDVELAAKWPGEPGKLAEALATVRFIDDRHGVYHIHDLFDHAPEYVKSRWRMERKRREAGERVRNERGTSANIGGHVTPYPATVPNSSEHVANGYASPAPAPAPAHNTPLTPQRGNGAADKPKRKTKTAKAITAELQAVAKRVVDHYQATVKPGRGAERGIKNVSKLLANGRTEAELKAAADRYAASSRGQELRMAVGNFFGEKAGYLDHLVGPAPSTNGCHTSPAANGAGYPFRPRHEPESAEEYAKRMKDLRGYDRQEVAP